MDKLFVRVLGPIELFADGKRRPLEGRRQRALLGLLALHAGTLVTQDRLIDELWGERPPRTAAKSLQNAVVQLRGKLEHDRRSPEVLVTEQGGYRLCLTEDRLDAAHFERLVAEGARLLAGQRPAEAGRVLEEALSLWRGPAYSEVAAQGVMANEAARLEELRLFAQDELLESKLQAGRHAEILAELRARIAEDPLRERRRRLLMTALYRCGRQEDALEVYRAARTDLSERLGIEPSPEFRALERAVLTQDPNLLGPMPSDAVVVGLPISPTAMIGREEQLSNLEDLLIKPETRLLTLTGAGGIGKTRLAVELARRAAGRFADGVYFTDLSLLDSAALVLPAIARTLGVHEAGELPLADRVKNAVRGRTMLLVLDNFEHVLEARSDLSLLLGAGAELSVLVTSRSRLRLYGEHVRSVPPLPLPPHGEAISAADLATYDAIALFVARSRTTNATFMLTDENAPAIAELCLRLEGIPLALELVAARSDAFSPNVRLQRVNEPLDLGTRGPVDVPERQQTLRGALDWSYDLLSQLEQELFARLAVFAGPFSEDAAVAICQAREPQLESLIDKSILTRIIEPTGNRLRMLETIRQYARERLDTQDGGDELEQRLINYYASLAERAEPELTGENQAEWLDQLDSEHDNLRAALGAALERSPEIALKMAAAIWRFWYIRSYLREGRMWLTQALERAEKAPSLIRAKALNGAGVFATETHDVTAADRLMVASLKEFESVDDRRGIGMATGDLGLIRALEGDYVQAGQLFERADAAFTELGDPRAAVFRGNLGYLKLHVGEHSKAVALLESARQTLASFALLSDTLIVEHSLAVAHLLLGNHAAARELAVRTARQALVIGERNTVLSCLETLAALTHAAADRETAARLIAFVDLRRAELGMKPNPLEQAAYGQPLQHARSDAADPRFAAAEAQARTMSYEEAVHLAEMQ